jgi:hypothetical protein
MTHQPVSVGDDGRMPGADPADGPVLAALRESFTQWRIGMSTELAKHRNRQRQQLLAAQPAYAPLSASGAIGSNGTLLLDLGGPQKGRRWVVRMVTVSDSGSFWNTMTNAQATVCTGHFYGNNVVMPQQVRWPFATLPNSATFGSDQMWVVPADHVLLSITGGTNLQNVQCTIWVQDFAELSPFSSEQEV